MASCRPSSSRPPALTAPRPPPTTPQVWPCCAWIGSGVANECRPPALSRAAGGRHRLAHWLALRWATYNAGSDFGHTSQGYWYRMREQHTAGWPLAALRHFLKLSMWDERGRLWQCVTSAVIDDFGNLVEVTP